MIIFLVLIQLFHFSLLDSTNICSFSFPAISSISSNFIVDQKGIYEINSSDSIVLTHNVHVDFGAYTMVKKNSFLGYYFFYGFDDDKLFTIYDPSSNTLKDYRSQDSSKVNGVSYLQLYNHPTMSLLIYQTETSQNLIFSFFDHVTEKFQNFDLSMNSKFFTRHGQIFCEVYDEFEEIILCAFFSVTGIDIALLNVSSQNSIILKEQKTLITTDSIKIFRLFKTEKEKNFILCYLHNNLALSCIYLDEVNSVYEENNILNDCSENISWQIGKNKKDIYLSCVNKNNKKEIFYTKIRADIEAQKRFKNNPTSYLFKDAIQQKDFIVMMTEAFEILMIYSTESTDTCNIFIIQLLSSFEKTGSECEDITLSLKTQNNDMKLKLIKKTSNLDIKVNGALLDELKDTSLFGNTIVQLDVTGTIDELSPGIFEFEANRNDLSTPTLEIMCGGGCYHSCSKCEEKGNILRHNCLSCAEGFFFIEGYETNCLKKEEIPTGYYFEEKDNMYKQCHLHCDKCETKGNNEDNKCLTCKNHLAFNPLNNKKCVNDCDGKGWYIEKTVNEYTCTRSTINTICEPGYDRYLPITGQCVENICDENFKFLQNGECVKDCDSFYAKNEEYFECINCKSINKYFYKGQCVSERPINTYFVNEEYNAISDCLTILNEEYIDTKYGIKLECTVQCPNQFFFNGLLCQRCHPNCDSCSKSGDDINNNCITCKESLFQNPYEPKNCIKKCEKFWYYDVLISKIICKEKCLEKDYLIENSNECVFQCPKEYSVYRSVCVKKCPQNFISYNGDCIENISEIDADDIIKSVEDDITSLYPDLSKPSTISGRNKTIQIFPTNNIEEMGQQAENANASKINITLCEKKVRESMQIEDEEKLYIFKLDYFNQEANRKNVVYKLYDSKGKEINITSICANIQIDISLPILYNFADNERVDIYNSSDSYFNSICTTSVGGKDSTLAIRRKEEFKNATTFCALGCFFDHLDSTTNRVYCKCNTLQISTNLDSVDGAKIFTFLNSSNTFGLLKCYKNVFDKEQIFHNSGFWIFLSFFFFEIIVVIANSGCGYRKLMVYLYRYITRVIEGEKFEIKIEKETIARPGPIYSHKTASKSNLLILSQNKCNLPEIENNVNISSFSKPNNKSQCFNPLSHIIKSESNEKRKSSQINLTSTLKKDFLPKDTKKYNTFTISSSISRKSTLVSQNENKILTFCKKGDKVRFPLNQGKDCLSLPSIPSNNSSRYEKTFVSETQLSYSNIDEADFEEAMIKDNRNYCEIFVSFLSNKHMIFSVFLNKDPFIPSLLRLFICVFTISLFFVFNIALFSEEYITERYYNDNSESFSYLIKNELDKSVYASFLVSIMNFIMSFIFIHYDLTKAIKNYEDKGEMYFKEISIAIKKMKRRFFFCFTFLTICLGFFWYYVSCFCAVYQNSQKPWVKGSLITFTFNNIFSFGFLLIASLLRLVANKWKSFIFFKLSTTIIELC